MDGNLAEKVRELLSDPEMFAKISQIASGMSPSPAPQEPAARPTVTSDAAPVSAIGSLISQASGGGSPLSSVKSGDGDRRFALLSSLRPLLREDKRKKLDNLKTALTIANLVGGFKKHT